jgi:hypothetical protein
MGNTTCCSDQHRHDSELDLSISKQQTIPKAVVAVAKDSAINISKNIEFRDTKPETAHLQSLDKHAQQLEVVELESDQSDGMQEGSAASTDVGGGHRVIMKRMESADSSWAKSRENPPVAPPPPPAPAPGQPSYIVVVEADNRLGVSNLSEDVSPSYCKSIERSIEEKKKKPLPDPDTSKLQTNAGGAWNPEVDRKLEYLFSKNTYTLRNERSVIKTKFNLDDYPSTRTIDMQGGGKIKDVLKVTKLEDLTNTDLFCNVKYIKAMIYLYPRLMQQELF